MKNYFDYSNYLAKALFESAETPWEALSKIVGFIAASGSSLGLKEIAKSVFVGDSVKIDPSAKIEGPAIIGSNSRIGDFVKLRSGVIIGQDCNINHATEVKHSIIGNHSNAAHLSYIGDSLVGNDVNIAAGAVLANYKNGAKNLEVSLEWGGKIIPTGLEKFGAVVGDGVKIASNAVTNPGTVIGKNTLIYPLVSIRGTIPANKVVKLKANLEIVDKD